ncbi:MAG: HIT domain-containing protein, partial [Candidatus Rokubacteria bacterium]|nr:HIT domain-containing protein [Candidatus Rokubacteria bacterium]
ACFDLAFVPDSLAVPRSLGDTFDPAVRWGTGTPRLDPLPVITVMAAVTRHVAGLDEASLDELADCMRLVQIAVRALKAVYRPDGFNVGVNQGAVAGAGVAGHLHVHVVPRWNGDTSFMTAIGDTKVLPESLQDTYDRLSAALRS